MGLLNLLSKDRLSLGGLTPKVYNQQQARLEKTFVKQSKLDLDGKTPEKYLEKNIEK